MVNLEDEVLVVSTSSNSNNHNSGSPRASGNAITMERKNAVAQLKSSRSTTDNNNSGGVNTTNKAQTLKELQQERKEQQNGLLLNGNGMTLTASETKRDEANGRIMPTENGLNHHTLDGEDSLEEDSPIVVSRDDHCLLCNSPFNLLLHKRFICKVCALNVCRNCSLFDDPDWICTVCDQQRAISSQLNCQSWLCKRIKSPGDKELVHLINAKLRLEAELRGGGGGGGNSNGSKRLLNGSNSNGSTNGHHHHSTSTEVLIQREAPFLELGPNQLEHLIALRSDVELIVVKLLGTESIDYAHVGLLFDDGQYSDTVQAYTEPLASLLAILQESIYASQSGSAREPPPLPPTEAYARLKDLLGDISEKAFHLTPLRPILRLHLEEWLQADCASYEHLLANAIVNQIVEVSQSRFLTASSSSALTLKSATSSSVASCSSVSGHYSPISTTTATSFGRVRSSCSGGSLYGSNSNESAGTGSDIAPPTKLSAGEVDPYGSYDNYHHRGTNGSYHRNGSISGAAGQNMNTATCEEASNFDDVDEVEFEEVEDEDEEREEMMDDEEEDDVQSNDSFDINLDFEPVRVHFPEAGVDLVDSRKFPSVESDLSQDSGIKLIDNSSSWQDNWLFKKHKENKSYHQYHLNSDLHYGYMALALSDPVPMLIPNPSQPYAALIGEAEVDAVSDLEEHACSEGVEEEVSIEDLFSDLDEEDSEEETSANDAENADAKASPTIAAKLLSSSTSRLQAQSQALPRQRPVSVNLSKEALAALAANAKWKRWAKIKVPDYVPSELRSAICSSIPNSHQTNLEYVPCITLKPASTATGASGGALHSGITAQFVVRASGLLPLYFAWYKDGALIACSDEATSASSTVTLEENEETKQRQLARVFFGVRFTHRRTVESQTSTNSSSPFRLIVFNENECILEVRKTAVGHCGTYSVVAYNHAGYDWADFTVAVDRTHYTACSAPAVLSPRPVRRRPQNKPKKSLVCTVIEQQQLSIINHLAKAVSKAQGTATPIAAAAQLDMPPVPRPRSITPTTNIYSDQKQQSGTAQTPEPIANFKQRTWKEREEERSNSVELPNESRRKISNGQLYDSTDGRLSRANSVASTSATPMLVVEEMKSTVQPVESSPEDEGVNEGEPVMEIAEREHKKWLRPDVELVNNPYTAESVEARAKHLLELSSLEEAQQKAEHGTGENGELKEDEEEEEDEATRFEKKKFFSDRDITRYKRDYYLPKNRPTSEDSQVFSILNTLGGQTNGTTGHQQKPVKETNPAVTTDNQAPQLINGASAIEVIADDHSDKHIEELERVVEAEQPQIITTTTLTTTITPSPEPLSFSDSSSVASSVEDEVSPLDSSEPQSPSSPPAMSTVLTTPLVNGTAHHSTVILNGVNHHNHHSPMITPPPTETTVLSISKPLIVGTEVKTSPQPLTNGNARPSPSSSSLDSYSDLPKSRPLKDQVLAKLPSVKNLVSLFSKDKEQQQQPPLHSSSSSPVHSLSPSPNHYSKGAYTNGRVASSGASSLQVPLSPAVRNANNFKVHSLTARSMPREFREQSAKNIPHTTNRIRLTNELLGTTPNTVNGNRILEQIESDQSAGNSAAESLTSEDLNFSSSSGNSSLQSSTGATAANGTTSNGHHTIGDQTIAEPSSNVGPVEVNGERSSADSSGRYRPILQRASYWQKRMEEGLVSDQKVKAPFPTMNGESAKEQQQQQQQQQSEVPRATEAVGQ